MIKRIIPKIFIALLLLVCGGLWLSNGLGIGIDFPFRAFWATILVGIGVAFLIGAFCFNSKGYLYFFGLFASFGSVFLVAYYANSEWLTMSKLWPLLIASPGVASFIMFFVRKFSVQHIKYSLFFIGISVGIYLANNNIVPWEIMIPIVVVLLGLIILANVIFRKSTSWDMADNELSDYVPYSEEDDDKEE